MYRKATLSFNDAEVSIPDGIDCRIDETTGFGKVTLLYVTDPKECYEVYKVFKEWYGNRELVVPVNHPKAMLMG